MAKPVLTGKKKYHQGYFRPIHPQKYIGNPANIIYRSGWERLFLKWCDTTPSVLAYGSEELIIPYVSPVDRKVHRYYVDFYIVVKQQDGSVKKFAIEIKPESQTKVPKVTKNMLTETLRSKIQTYEINMAKWESAKRFCKSRGIEFVILTEKHLLKKRKSSRKHS